MDEETLKLGVNATPQFIGALTEMVWAQIGPSKRYLDWKFSATDCLHQKPPVRILRASQSTSLDSRNIHALTEYRESRHAGRATISVEDVMLLSRRNEGLEDVLRSFVNKQKAGKSKAIKKR